MDAPEVTRRLVAILCADVKGYSRLMGVDEAGTLRTLTAHRSVFSDRIAKRRGRVINAPGDALLAEFGSVVDAVGCAAEIQRELDSKNAELPPERRMEFRIGVNLGDVMVEGDSIYGDGINIAARLESLAEGGGICISGTVYDSVRGKLELEYEALGEKAVKNIAEPVRVFKVLLDPAEKTEQSPPQSPLADSAPPLPDKPSVAVLAFQNMSGDPEQEYFSDGISEDIITDLSKLSGLFVIARNSSFAYKGKPVDLRQVGRELGVRYVLEGSVRKSGDRVRITAQLIEVETGHHLWAERYDRKLEDMFALQDEITEEVVTALDVKLLSGERSRAFRKFLKTHEGRRISRDTQRFWERPTKVGIPEARRLFEQLMLLEPEGPYGYMGMGFSFWWEVRFGWGSAHGEPLRRAREFAEKAKALGEPYHATEILFACLSLSEKKFEDAIEHARFSKSLSPNHNFVAGFLAEILHFRGEAEEAISEAEFSLRLSPVAPPWVFAVLGAANAANGMFEEALAAVRKAVNTAPEFLEGHLVMADALVGLGRVEEARAKAAEILKSNRRFSLAAFAKTQPFKEPAHLERYLGNLRAAGLPE